MRLFLLALLSFVVLDAVWLGMVATSFYKTEIGGLMRKSGVVWWAAGVVYVVLALGLVVFVVPLVRGSEHIISSFLWGSLFGFVVYAVYDFTNYATLSGWSLKFLVADIAWGSFASGIVAVVLGLLGT